MYLHPKGKCTVKKIPRQKENLSRTKIKSLLKKFGLAGILFFTIKGIISSFLLYFLGSNAWKLIKGYCLSWIGK
ncbi:MAG: hypothetical protein FDW93_02760 [Bergeyella sp.]|nr:hypothetical protein [Bergeyella sp.]